MTNAILRGKPDAGNPHVRFDEGEVASAKPRRGSLLYKKADLSERLDTGSSHVRFDEGESRTGKAEAWVSALQGRGFQKIVAVSFGLVLSVAAAAADGQSVFDDAKAWWKFDRGGNDGVLATKSEIHDVRDASRNQPTTLYGSQGGPLWSVMDVRLPYQRRTVRSTALHFPCDARMNGTTPQARYTSLAFSDLQTHGSELTVVARVRFEGRGVQAADTMLWNNAFMWGNNAGSIVGFIKCNSVATASDPTLTYAPYAFVGKNTFGNSNQDKTIQMKLGEWYDVAYLLSEETVGGTRYDVVTYVVADMAGLQTYTMRNRSQRVTSATTTYARMAAMNHNSNWVTCNADCGKNSGDDLKNFDGWIHQLAVWHRKLSLDEVKEAFGRPAEHPEQDVFAEASNWLRFDKDINGDGKLQDDEIRDLRNWSRPQDGKPSIVSQFGPRGGPVWTNVTVDLPGRGVSVKSPCLYFPIETNITVNGSGETIYSAWPSGVRLGNMTRAGSYTVMARICPMRQVGAVAHACAYFYNNGFNWGDSSGSEFGLNVGLDKTGNTFYPTVLLSHSNFNAVNLTMSTNTWYDIAVSVTDNGANDSAVVAVQDVQHGFRYQTFDVGANASTTFVSWWLKDVLGSETTYDKMTDFYNKTTDTLISSGNASKAFHGFIHELAVWNRALTKEEIASAFSHPNNMVMGVGTANGASGEFAGTEGTYDCQVDATGMAWRDIAGTLDAEHSELTFRFTPDANQRQLVHYLHVKAAAVGASVGEKAQLSLHLNGKPIAPAVEVGAYDDLWCVLPIRSLQTGENVLKIAYAGGTAASFALDSAEIVGSWQLGVKDGKDSEFTQEGNDNAAPDYTVGDRRLKHVVRSLTKGWNRNDFHFYVPAEIAAKHAHAFELAVVNQVATGIPSFAIDLNGVEKFASPTDRQMTTGEKVTFDVESGELNPGWNTITMRFTGASGWITFDYYKFAISDYHLGMAILLR